MNILVLIGSVSKSDKHLKKLSDMFNKICVYSVYNQNIKIESDESFNGCILLLGNNDLTIKCIKRVIDIINTYNVLTLINLCTTNTSENYTNLFADINAVHRVSLNNRNEDLHWFIGELYKY